MPKQFIYTCFLVLSLQFTYAQSVDSTEQEFLNKLETLQEDSSKVNTLNEVSLHMMDIDLEQSTKYAKQSIELAKKINFTNGLEKAYHHCTNAFYHQYLFDSALVYAQLNLELYKKNNDFKGQARLHRNIGFFFHRLNNYPEAIYHYKKSAELSLETKNQDGLIKVYNNLGAAYYDQGNYEKALDNYFACLELSEHLKDTVHIVSTLGNIGGVYHGQDKKERALEYHKRAYNLSKQTNNNNLTTADAAYRLGNLYSDNQKFDSAVAMLHEAQIIYSMEDDVLGIIMVKNMNGTLNISRYEQYESDNNLDYIYEAKKQLQEALKLNIAEVNDVQELSFSYQELGKVNMHLKDYPEAIKQNNKVIELASEFDLTPNLLTAFDNLSQTYDRMGNTDKAYKYYKQLINLKDSLKNDENVELLTEMSMQHEFDKQQEIQELEYEEEQRRSRLIRAFILSVLGIVIVFFIQVIRNSQQRKRANILLGNQKKKIEHQNKEITDSIRYAKRIQTAILPSPSLAIEILPEHFIYFTPRDIVSGDYYWMKKIGSKVVITAADCTGHGVPGAFMSMLGVSFLNEIVNENTITPHEILNKLRASVKQTLGQTGKSGEAKDGMDVAMCVLDEENMILQFAGAYNPLLLYREGELIEIKADRMPIGIHIKEKESFTFNEMELQKGDTFYIFSDGYPDQFGGERNQKFKTKNFKQLLSNIQKFPMEKQRDILHDKTMEWRGDYEQVDDIIVIGIRV